MQQKEEIRKLESQNAEEFNYDPYSKNSPATTPKTATVKVISNAFGVDNPNERSERWGNQNNEEINSLNEEIQKLQSILMDQENKIETKERETIKIKHLHYEAEKRAQAF